MAVGLRAARTRLSSNRQIRRGQSLVEFTLVLPVLLIMLSGLVEAAIALNVYLDVIDSAREVARHVADFDPFNPNSTNINQSFYDEALRVSNLTLEMADQIQLDRANPRYLFGFCSERVPLA